MTKTSKNPKIRPAAIEFAVKANQIQKKEMIMENISVIRAALSGVIVAVIVFNVFKSLFNFNDVSSCVIAMCMGLFLIFGFGEGFTDFLSDYAWAIIILAGLLAIIIVLICNSSSSSQRNIEQSNDNGCL